jgi:hypothetical protein
MPRYNINTTLICLAILATRIVTSGAFLGGRSATATTATATTSRQASRIYNADDSSSSQTNDNDNDNDNDTDTDKMLMFESAGWKNIADNLSSFPLFTIATAENNFVAYSISVGDDKTFNIPFFYCDVTEALVELEKAQVNNKDYRLIPFPLNEAFKMWCDDKAVIVPSKASILEAGAPAGTNQIGQRVPMWACMEISEEQEGGLPPKLPIFMGLEDANAAVLEAVAGDKTKFDDLEVVCLSLDGAIEQLVTVPEETPSFHFVPPSKSIKYIEENIEAP